MQQAVDAVISKKMDRWQALKTFKVPMLLLSKRVAERTKALKKQGAAVKLDKPLDDPEPKT